LVIAAYGVLIAHAARFGWLTMEHHGSDNRTLWLGLVIILASLALKCVALESWPPNLNTYSAMTGEEAIKALGGKWPSPFFAIRNYPLAEGGQSPLHLPVLLASMKLFGVTVFAVRFAEVFGSTILLLVFWIWLRTALPGGWALAALTLFAFSPWHLAQSRFGTFYCSCAALSLALLWFGERTRDASGTWKAWFWFGLCAAAIGWAYAPLQVLYAFFGFLVLAGFVDSARRWQPLIAIAVFAVVVALQLSQGGRQELMRSNFGQLATDTVIWRKDAAHTPTTTTQPPVVVADNFARNIKWWFEETFKEPNILIWWAPALGVGFLYALYDLLRAGWIRGLYYLVGMLPPLLIFPLHRRTLIIWPLVYVAGVRFCRDLVGAAAGCRGQPWTRRITTAAIVVTLLFTSLHGLQLYAAGNPAGLVYPYFGPPDQYLMIAAAKRLIPNYHLLFVNPGMMKHVLSIGLHEPALATQRPNPYEMLVIAKPEDGLANRLRPGRKNCFIYLNDEQHGWVTPSLLEELPGGKLVEHRNSPGAPVIYSLYFYPDQ
jgi:hypothetical protein